jgi:predicted 3-demethylubiquinone-9 3-methyltransferase (glyoxalase superfamily)
MHHFSLDNLFLQPYYVTYETERQMNEAVANTPCGLVCETSRQFKKSIKNKGAQRSCVWCDDIQFVNHPGWIFGTKSLCLN